MYGLDEQGKFNGEAFYDIDNSPVKKYLIENMKNPGVSFHFHLATGKRPTEELYQIKNDPYCIYNLSEDEQYSEEIELMRTKLFEFLRKTEDPRIVGPNPDIFENYQRFYTIRSFPKPDWVK